MFIRIVIKRLVYVKVCNFRAKLSTSYTPVCGIYHVTRPNIPQLRSPPHLNQPLLSAPSPDKSLTTASKMSSPSDPLSSSSGSKKRLLNELKTLHSSPLPSFLSSLGPVSDAQILIWEAIMLGPVGGAYHGKSYVVDPFWIRRFGIRR